jgi:hypothetical protein
MAPYGSHTAHVAPIWHMCLPQDTKHLPCGTIWLPYGSQLVLKLHNLFTPSIRLSYRACCTHLVHVAPMWHM